VARGSPGHQHHTAAALDRPPPPPESESVATAVASCLARSARRHVLRVDARGSSPRSQTIPVGSWWNPPPQGSSWTRRPSRGRARMTSWGLGMRTEVTGLPEPQTLPRRHRKRRTEGAPGGHGKRTECGSQRLVPDRRCPRATRWSIAAGCLTRRSQPRLRRRLLQLRRSTTPRNGSSRSSRGRQTKLRRARRPKSPTSSASRTNA